MPYRYCENCPQGLDVPTPIEAFGYGDGEFDGVHCSACGHTNPVPESDRNMLIRELFDRVTELESQLKEKLTCQ